MGMKQLFWISFLYYLKYFVKNDLTKTLENLCQLSFTMLWQIQNKFSF
jgi:hypothetical protein